ncbi:MAG: patatin-like phospholipase family protein [Saprospiraceae bacterium]|nr:patatin-like phospholipase family protein [Saprospiraceae bacterium]
MNALVISGGGSKGAFASGVATYLMQDCGREYDIFVGTSTGSLLAPLLASDNLEKARNVFTTARQKDIFTICPFIIKKKDGVFKTKFNHLGILRMFWRREKTLGDSHKLRELIEKSFTKKDFERLKANNKKVVAAVTNFTTQTLEYKSSDDYSYQDFCDWIWASSNLIPFMSLVTKDGQEYGDGGFGDVIPIRQAVDMGATHIDVIVLRPERMAIKLPPVQNALQLMMRAYDFMFHQIVRDDITIGQLAAANKKVKIQFYYTPRLLAEQAFIFDPEQLNAWWEEGYEAFRGITF